MYSLSGSVPYRLNRLGSRLGSLFGKRIAGYGVTVPMYQVLASLSERPDQTLGELAQITSMLMPTMSRLVGTMVDRGWLTRERRPVDERSVHINLTEAGRSLSQKLLREADHYQNVVTEGLSKGEIEDLKLLLDRIYRALDSLEAELI